MEERRYLLPANYKSLENELFRVQRVLKAERDIADIDLRDQMENYESSMMGAFDVAQSMEKMVRLFSRLVGISTCALRDLEQIKKGSPRHPYDFLCPIQRTSDLCCGGCHVTF